MLSQKSSIILFCLILFLSMRMDGQTITSFQLKIYSLKDKEQQSRVDNYLKGAYLPALHRAGIAHVGVFVPVGNDTAMVRRLFVLIPFSSLSQWEGLDQKLSQDKQYDKDGAEYLNSSHTNPPYMRLESILLSAFSGMKSVGIPKLAEPRNENIYELRSYEGPTERIYENKVKMFNDGDEIGLFKRLGFNAVFYAEVISGAHMPNLMYMTSFDNMASHDQHWKSFVDDAYWKKLSTMPEYQNNVSHIDIQLLHPADYSEL